MDINQINGKAPEQKTPDFEIIVKTNNDEYINESCKPESNTPCNGYVLFTFHEDHAECSMHGIVNMMTMAQELSEDERFRDAMMRISLRALFQ